MVNNSVSLSSASRMRPLKLSTNPFLRRLARRNVMLSDAQVAGPGEHRVRRQFGSVALTIIFGLSRLAIRSVNSRTIRRPEIEVSTIARRHSRVTSSTMLRTPIAEPPALLRQHANATAGRHHLDPSKNR